MMAARSQSRDYGAEMSRGGYRSSVRVVRGEERAAKARGKGAVFRNATQSAERRDGRMGGGGSASVERITSEGGFGGGGVGRKREE